jgi:hypothetical protein
VERCNSSVCVLVRGRWGMRACVRLSESVRCRWWRCNEQEAIAGHKRIKLAIGGGQDVLLDPSRTLAQSGIRAGATHELVLKSAGLLGGMQRSCARGIVRMLWGTESAEVRAQRKRVSALEQQLASAAAATAPATTALASVGFLQVRELSWRESARAIKRERKGEEKERDGERGGQRVTR